MTMKTAIKDLKPGDLVQCEHGVATITSTQKECIFEGNLWRVDMGEKGQQFAGGDDKVLVLEKGVS